MKFDLKTIGTVLCCLLALYGLIILIRKLMNKDKSKGMLEPYMASEEDLSFINSVVSKNINKASDYNEIVSKMSTMDLTDPKIQTLLKTMKGSPIGNLKFVDEEVYARDLFPTQNEVDISKSLAFPLKDKKFNSLLKYLTWTEGSPAVEFPQAIVTGGPDGKDLIDGHHRWSQVYAINPDVKIKVLRILSLDDPINVLKNTQLCIAAASKAIQSETVKGSNILDPNVPLSEITEYVRTKVDPAVLKNVADYFEVSEDTSLKMLEDIFSKNLAQMRENNRPRSCSEGESIYDCAPPRAYMPQTDDKGMWKNVCSFSSVQ